MLCKHKRWASKIFNCPYYKSQILKFLGSFRYANSQFCMINSHIDNPQIYLVCQSAYHKSANSQIFHHGTERTKYMLYKVLPLFGLYMAKPPKISAQVFSSPIFFFVRIWFRAFYACIFVRRKIMYLRIWQSLVYEKLCPQIANPKIDTFAEPLIYLRICDFAEPIHGPPNFWLTFIY